MYRYELAPTRAEAEAATPSFSSLTAAADSYTDLHVLDVMPDDPSLATPRPGHPCMVTIVAEQWRGGPRRELRAWAVAAEWCD